MGHARRVMALVMSRTGSRSSRPFGQQGPLRAGASKSAMNEWSRLVSIDWRE
jgi:hypothetical protein